MTVARRLWRSPALRFLALGAALFGLEAIVHARRSPEHFLTAPRATVRALRDELREQLHRDPTAPEFTARLEGWADDERLYREAVTRRVWEGDPVLRQRLVERARWSLRGEAATAPPTAEELARTLARHPDRYAVPARVSFTQVFVSRARHPAAFGHAGVGSGWGGAHSTRYRAPRRLRQRAGTDGARQLRRQQKRPRAAARPER